MVSVTHLLMRPGRRMSIMIGAIALLAVGMSPMASSQDQSTTIAKDAIFARKILMDTINTNMDELETMTTSDKGVNLTEGREHADLISVMLMGFRISSPRAPISGSPTSSAIRAATPMHRPIFSPITPISMPGRRRRRRPPTAPAARSRTATSRRMWRSCGWHATHATGSISSLINSRSALTRRSEMARRASKT